MENKQIGSGWVVYVASVVTLLCVVFLATFSDDLVAMAASQGQGCAPFRILISCALSLLSFSLPFSTSLTPHIHPLFNSFPLTPSLFLLFSHSFPPHRTV